MVSVLQAKSLLLGELKRQCELLKVREKDALFLEVPQRERCRGDASCGVLPNACTVWFTVGVLQGVKVVL